MKSFKSQLRNLGGAIIAGAGGVVFVAKNGSAQKEVLYNPATGAVLANPVALTRGSFAFNTLDTVAMVDLYVLSPTGHMGVFKNVKPSGDATINIDTRRLDTTLVIPFHYLDQVGNATETPTGFVLPGAVQSNPGIDVIALDAGITIEAGTLSTDSGDADGFIDAVSIATLGYKKGSIANGTPTLGALLWVQDSANAGDEAPEQDVSMIGKQVTYTLLTGADTAAGFIVLPTQLRVSAL